MMDNLTAQLPKLCPILAAISDARSCIHCNKVLITYLWLFTYNHSTLRARSHWQTSYSRTCSQDLLFG